MACYPRAMSLRTVASIAAISLVACGGNVVVDHDTSGGGHAAAGGQPAGGHGGIGGQGGIAQGGMGGMGGIFPDGPGGFGTMSTGDVNPVGTGTSAGGFGGTTMSTGDVNPVTVGVGGAPSPSSVGVGPGMCMAFSCFDGGNGACGCNGQCTDGATVSVHCGPNGGICRCRKNGALVGTCEPNPARCEFPGGCCDAFF